MRRWFADAVEQNQRGAGVPEDYIPARSSDSYAWKIEANIFLQELPTAARKHVLNRCRFSRLFKTAARYVIDCLLEGERPRMREIRRRWSGGPSRFVYDWTIMRLRDYLRPWQDSFRDLPIDHPADLVAGG